MSTLDTSSDVLTRDHHGAPVPRAGTYALDPMHSSASFVARHLMISKVRGSFERLSGSIVIADEPERSSAEVVIDATSVTTGVGDRDAHLRSPDFFDVERYPSLSFRSTAVAAAAEGHWAVTGELTIREITRPVVLDVVFDGAVRSPWGDARIAFTASTEIDREDWGLTWNQALEAGGVVVGKTVRIEIEVEASAQ